MQILNKFKLLMMAAALMVSSLSLSAQDREITGSIETSNDYVPGLTMDAEFILDFDSPDAEWADEIYITFPEGFQINSAPDIGGLDFTEINGQTVVWGPDGYLSSNNSPFEFTVNVTVPSDASGDYNLAYEVIGDQWGSEPHEIVGDAVWAMTPTLPAMNFAAMVDPSSTAGNAKALLEWENHPAAVAGDIEGYNIYRGVSASTELLTSTTDMSYVDENLDASTTYYYQVSVVYAAGESMLSDVQEVTAMDSPAFAITPESHDFEEVGLLDGEVFYGAENQTFVVENAGVGTLAIQQEPYFFSNNTDDYAVVLEDGTTFPYEIAGPSSSTGENFSFEVAFNPTTSGESSTLLVVKDDLDRVVRTFSLSGSAYDIPDYDLVENAMLIDQDWNTNFDYAVESSFEGFYNDYNLAAPSDVDKVYKTTVEKDSYITFEDNSGVADFAVFAEGDAIEEANNIYEDGQTAVDPGTYYFVVSGVNDYSFNIHIEGQEPVLSVVPGSMDLGDVPIGAWHQGGEFVVTNTGGQSLIINGVATSDENNVFGVDDHYEYPYEITTNEMRFSVNLNADTPGDYEGALLIEDDVTTHIYPISGTAYNPPVGDVFETAYDIELDGSGDYSYTASVAFPMRNNYIIDNSDVTDVVYRFAYPTDGILNVSLADTVAGFNGEMELYRFSASRNLNPTTYEPIATGTEINDFELWAGEYFIVLSGNPDEGDYTLNMNITDMPAPEAVTLVSPEDGNQEVSVNPELVWEVGAYTNNVDVYLDTQYPPQNMVANLNGETMTYEPETLDPAQVYFWRVVANNENGTSESETWAFTTQLPPPLFVTGEIFDFTNVHLEWNNPLDGTVEWTETFEGGEVPEGWTTMSNATGSTAGWYVTDNGSSSYFTIPDHTTYAVANDDAAGSGSDGSMDYLITPEQDFSQGNAATLTFDSFFTGEFSQTASVEISTDGGETWEVVHEMEANTAWVDGLEVDLSDYIGEDYSSLWIGFHADDNGSWASGWAVDNVTVGIEYDTPWSRSFLGYNVYQNGTQINDEIVTATEYDVEELTSGTYEFGVSAIYDEGESDTITIEEITILGRGMVSGQVTDVDSGEGVADASITFVANDTIIDNVTVNTDADGMYSIEVPVVEGGYSATAAASGYEDVTEQADVLAEDEITVDFVLGETPIPVTNVVATKGENDGQVTVTWDQPSEFPTYEIMYDDGTAENATAWNAGYEGNMNALKITPSGYPATIKEAKIHIFDGSWPAGNILTPMEIVVLDDDGANGLPNTILGSVEVTPDAPNWVTVDLASLNITIGEGDFYIAHRQISTYPDCPPTAIDEDNPQGRSYAYDASVGTWAAATYDSFMIRATVSGPQGTETLGYEEVTVNTSNNTAAVSLNPSNVENGTYTVGAGETKVINEASMASRAISHYEVYRFTEENIDNMAAWTLLADDVTATEYVDASWADAEMGVYYYAVKAVYTMTEADPMISNMVAKDMISTAVVIVDLNTGDSPEGAVVTFENVNVDTTYVRTVPADGTVQIPEFWKGVYNLSVTMDDYDSYLEENIDIFEGAFIRNVTLKETLAVPANLASTVDCKDVTITWEGGTGSGGAGDEFTEGFENAFPPEGWVHDQTNSLETWEQVGTVSFTSGDVVPHEGEKQLECYWEYEAQDEWIITPEFAAGSGSSLTFWTYVTLGSPNNDHYYVKVSEDGGSTWDILWDASAEPASENHYDAPVTLDLSDYAGSDVKVAWHASASAGLWYAWFIDDITIESNNQVLSFNGETLTAKPVSAVVTDSQDQLSKDNSSVVGSSDNSRELMGYNVYRDGELITDTPVAETEYTDENLAGGTYSYEVSAVFTTGESALAGPIEASVAEIVAPENFTAQVQSTNNVELTWDALDIEGLVGYHVYRNGEMINDDVLTTNMFIDYDITEDGTYEYYVVAEFDGGCMSEPSDISEVEIVGVGIDDLENAINVYPNPAKSIVNIEVSNNIENLRIVNYVGQEVYSKSVLGENVVNVNTESYDAGSYIVQFVTNEGNVINKRLVIVK